MVSQVSVIRFKFDEIEDKVDNYEDYATDDNGTEWQLFFTGFNRDESDTFSFIPGQKEGVLRLTITARVSLVVRNRWGDAAFEYNIPTNSFINNDGGPWDDSWNFIKWPELR